MPYTVKIQGGNTPSLSDCGLILVNQSYMPILSLTDIFVNRNLINTIPVTIENSINTIYKNDVNGNNVLTYLGSVTSYKRTRNNLFYDNEEKVIINIPILDDFLANDFKTTEIKTESFRYSNSMFSSRSNTALDINEADVVKDMTTPNTLVGVACEVLTLDINGLQTLNPKLTYRIDNGNLKLNNKSNIIDVLAIPTSALGVANLTLHTILSTGVNIKELAYIGDATKSHIFIPLV